MNRTFCVILALLALAVPAAAQVYGPPTSDPVLPASGPDPASMDLLRDELSRVGDGLNPVTMLDGASRLFPSDGEGGDVARMSAAINIVMLLTVIALVPSVMLMTTCFVRIVIVLSLLRQAMGTQNLPPPQVMLGLSLFMTILVMAPTIDRVRAEAVEPFRNGEIRDYDTLWNQAKQPLRDFMFDQIESTGHWSSLYMILNYRGLDTSQPELLTRADVDMVSLVPAFMLSELRTAFTMGFRVYLPFLVIDMVIASVLISMSMMMLPPVLISLPFKLLLFVMVDGWQLVVGSLLTSFVQEGGSLRQSAESMAAAAAASDGVAAAVLASSWWPHVT